MRARAGGGRHGERPAMGLELSSAREPDQAWRVLAVVSDSVRHAENKGAVVLGAAGVIGTVLYTWPETEHTPQPSSMSRPQRAERS
jgi:hypothetical protein